MAERYACEPESYPVDWTGEMRQENTNWLFRMMQHPFASIEDSDNTMLRLEALSLCAFDFHLLIKHTGKPTINFNNLERLTIESCTGLEEAFPMLTGFHVTPHNIVAPVGALHLRTFVLRHEDANDTFMLQLEAFLVSLKPLNTLHLLLEGLTKHRIILKVLKVHGNSLYSLVWDHRSGPRREMSTSTSYVYKDSWNLQVIAKYCSKLEGLGIALKWEDLTGSYETVSKVK